jgi:TolA-binding protein
MNQRLDRAAAVLLAHVDTTSDMAEQAALRAKIVDEAMKPTRWRPSRIAVLALVPVALSLLVLLLALRPASPSTITFAVGIGQTPGPVGSYLVPVGGAQLPIRFSEGSVVTLSPTARARVSSTSAKGARLLIETGKARCEIVHKSNAEWTIAAGPYTIEVRGTSFDVQWDTSTSTLEVQMRQGVVSVRGPGLDPGVELRDTQHFISSASARVESSPHASQQLSAPTSPFDSESPRPVLMSHSAGSSSAAGPTPDISREFPTTEADATSIEAGVTPIDAPGESVPRVAWPVLAARGEYRGVISEAEARGIENVLASASDADLAALADAARFLGRMDLATRALNATRARFAGSSRAAAAAYVLGRMADDSGNSSGALSWYERYLAEAPGGALAPEAMGRRMLVLKRAGNSQAAKEAADQYLQRFPRGPYSGVAKEMAQK